MREHRQQDSNFVLLHMPLPRVIYFYYYLWFYFDLFFFLRHFVVNNGILLKHKKDYLEP